MASLTIRRPPFQIDASVPFQWQPANPSFGLFGNTFTFLAIAFERYMVSATRQAMPRITDPAVAEEADAFLRQEAQHARAHRLHANAMIAQYPDLEETFAAANAAYDELLEREDVEFHLAYIANLEATFTTVMSPRAPSDRRASGWGSCPRGSWSFGVEATARRCCATSPAGTCGPWSGGSRSPKHRDTTRPMSSYPPGCTNGTRRTTPAPTSPPSKGHDYERTGRRDPRSFDGDLHRC
jgi:hypothetical protein